MKFSRSVLVLALLVCTLGAFGQSPRSDIVTLQSAAAATGNGTALDVGLYGGVAVQITGTFSATVTFEATIDRTNWIAVKADNLNDRTSATTATAAGIFQVPLSGAVQFRARISAYSSGSVTVKARGVAGQISLKQSSGGGGGSGTVTDFSAGDLSPLFTTSEATTTTTPALSFSLSNALAHKFFGNNTGSTGAPDFVSIGTGDLPSGIPYANLNLTGAILNADLAGSIANAKLANSAITIAGSSTSLGGSITASTILDSIGSTQGQILYRGASGWAVLNPGTSGQVLQSGGAAANPSWTAAGGASGANPTASVGLSAVNGSASTFMRSDGAPALDQSIAPTWTGIHTFNNGVTTGTGASSGTVFNYNSLTTGTGANFASSSVTSGSVVNIASTSTAAASSTLKGLNIAISGANGTTAQTVTGAAISVTNTNATSGTNVALTLTASGATTANTALNVTAGQILTAANGALSTGNGPAITATGTWITGGSATTTKPYVLIETSGATSTGWSTSGTGLGVNAASGFAGLLIDLQVNGSSKMSLNASSNRLQVNGGSIFSSNGVMIAAGGSAFSPSFQDASAGSYGMFFPSSATAFSVAGTEQLRLTSNTARFGPPDAASPSAYTLSVSSVVAGTTNTAGATRTEIASLGTSQGAPGRFHIQTGGMIAASGSTQQTAVDRAIFGATKVLTNNSATTVANVTVASNTSAGGTLDYVVEVFDGTDLQYETGTVAFGVTNKGGAFSGNTTTKAVNHQNATSGTLTVTWAISGANPGVLSVNANSSLTPSTGYPRVTYNLRSGSQQSISIQ